MFKLLRRVFFLGCLTVIGLLVVGAFTTYRMATWIPEPRPAVPPPTLTQREAAEAKIERLGRSLHLSTPAAPSGPRRFHLELSETDLNALLFARPDAQNALANAGIREPQLQLHNGRIQLSALGEMVGRDVYVTAAATPFVGPDGALGLQLADVRLGRLAAPARVYDVLATRVQAPLQEWTRKLDARLDRAAVQGSQLVLEGALRR